MKIKKSRKTIMTAIASCYDCEFEKSWDIRNGDNEDILKKQIQNHIKQTNHHVLYETNYTSIYAPHDHDFLCHTKGHLKQPKGD